jgi:DNA-binding LacI/PurR family transcriptional regulator
MNKRPTIIDVAKYAGVSKTTVSRVVRGEKDRVTEETRKKVFEAVDKLGYVHNALARGMRTNRTFKISLIIPDITNPFFTELARGIQDALDDEGYTVLMANSDWDLHREKNFLQTGIRNLVDGIIINPARITNDELRAIGVPTVVLGLGSDYPDFDEVGSDSQHGSILALEHLFELGHRRIGLINGLSRRSSRSSRLDGYHEFHQKHGLDEDPSLIINSPYGQDYGYLGMKELLDLQNKPTAVFAGNDILAIGALKAVYDAGLRVPDDISLIGMDDIYSVSVTMPPLTTVAKQKYITGHKAVELLIMRIENGQKPSIKKVSLPCELIIRGSTTRI